MRAEVHTTWRLAAAREVSEQLACVGGLASSLQRQGGNQRYRQAWPGADVIGHEETRRMINSRVPPYVRRFVATDSTFAKQREALRRSAETGVDDKGKPLDATERATATAALAKLEAARREFAAIAVEAPTVTFESALRIDLGGRAERRVPRPVEARRSRHRRRRRIGIRVRGDDAARAERRDRQHRKQ